MINSIKKKILITGSNGFIGKNLLINLEEKIFIKSLLLIEEIIFKD